MLLYKVVHLASQAAVCKSHEMFSTRLARPTLVCSAVVRAVFILDEPYAADASTK